MRLLESMRIEIIRTAVTITKKDKKIITHNKITKN